MFMFNPNLKVQFSLRSEWILSDSWENCNTPFFCTTTPILQWDRKCMRTVCTCV